MASKLRIPGTFGPFTFAHVHLTAPDTKGEYADDKYKVDGVAGPDSKPIKAVKAAIQDAAKKLGIKIVPGETNLPISNEKGQKDADGNREETGNRVLRAKSKFAPAIVDANGTPISPKKLAKLTIGAGSEGLIQGYFGGYTMKVKEKVNGKVVQSEIEGISFTLTGIQLISVAAGNSGASFGAYEGGGFSIDDDDEGEGLDDETEADDSSDEADDGDDGELDI